MTVTTLSSELTTDQTAFIEKYYNASVVDVRYLHDDLMILRVKPDDGIPEYHAGQYVTLGFAPFEPRIDGLVPPEQDKLKIIQRAYSISCPLIENGQLMPCATLPYVEFYIALVRLSDEDRLRLTPRLFGLKPGARLHFGHKITGKYVADPVLPDQNVIFLATGTGEAPHNAMTAELLAKGHRGHITSLCCVRLKKDVGYLEAHRQLEELNPRYRYRLLTTREPENLDPQAPGYIGKLYLQNLFESAQLPEWLGFDIDPAQTHVFLCGNPDMIGIPSNIMKKTHDESWQWPEGRGMLQILVEKGFTLPHGHHGVGNIHFEKYW